jgi:hypothetical protein
MFQYETPPFLAAYKFREAPISLIAALLTILTALTLIFHRCPKATNFLTAMKSVLKFWRIQQLRSKTSQLARDRNAPPANSTRR